jgi:hypothetical protein
MIKLDINTHKSFELIFCSDIFGIWREKRVKTWVNKLFTSKPKTENSMKTRGKIYFSSEEISFWFCEIWCAAVPKTQNPKLIMSIQPESIGRVRDVWMFGCLFFLDAFITFFII